MASWRFFGVNDPKRSPRPTASKAASYTVTPGDCGTTFFCTAAATFTLPAITAIPAGWYARFYNSADVAMTITAPSGKLVAFNNAAATSIAFSTSGEKIGAGVEVLFDGALYNTIVSLSAETVTPTIS